MDQMKKLAILIVLVVGLGVPSLVGAALMVDERGQLVWEGQVLGRDDEADRSGSSTSSGSSGSSKDEDDDSDEARSRTEIKDGEVRTEIRTETGERMEFRSREGETRTEVRSGGVRVRLERNDGEVKLKMETEEGEEEELGQQQELRIREREEENEVEVEVADDEFVVRRGQVEATTKFPLSVNLATNELVVTTPAGERTVTVLPDQAVQNMLAANVIDQILTSGEPTSVTPEESTSGASLVRGIITLGERQGMPVYEIAGVRNHRFLGFIPVQTQVTAVVSAETGELVATENVSLTEQVIGVLSF